MSSHPNIVVAASITTPMGVEVDDFLTTVGVNEDNEISLGPDPFNDVFSVHTQYDENSILEVENGFSTQDYITYGWGDTCTLEEFNNKVNSFEEKIKAFCDKYYCSYKIHIGANFW